MYFILFAENCVPVEFVTLKDGSEGLLIFNYDEKKYKFLDPFHPSDAIDVTDDIITNDIADDKNIIITKTNKKFYIKENKVWVADGLNEDTFQQMLNTTHHSNIYTIPIFKTIQKMLRDIKSKVYCAFPDDNTIKLVDGELFHFILKRVEHNKVEIKGLKKSQNDNEWKETKNMITL